MVNQREMALSEIKVCKENIEFYKKEIQRMESKIRTKKARSEEGVL
ncbi:MAG: hypothetical protein L6408_06810 [Nanoarchaeota archaeon]|nr:hypothetical protein [Nanoarchaeota archaeon]